MRLTVPIKFLHSFTCVRPSRLPSASTMRLLVGAFLGVASFAQTLPPNQFPQTGILPSGTYSLDKVETIDRVSGNVMYNIPLASLPKVGPEAPFQLKLSYNSANLGVSFSSFNDPREPYPPPHPVTRANFIGGGGWQYNIGQSAGSVSVGAQYASFQVAEEQRMGAPLSSGPPCYKTTRMWYLTADGARHQLGLFGDSDDGADGGVGFYATDPAAGIVRTCSATNPTGIASYIKGPLTYFTTDGTYIKVVIGYPAIVNGAFQYTAYYPDGTVVSNGAASATEQVSTMTDSNGNVTKFDYLNPNPGIPGNTEEIISNAAGSITIKTSPRAADGSLTDTITTSGYGGQPLTWTVNWGVISFGGPNGYYDCDTLDDYCGADGTGPFTITQIQGFTGFGEMLVIKSIILPSPTGVPLSFQFGYSDGFNNHGWGNLNNVTYPSGLNVKYNYYLDGSTQNMNQTGLFNVNPVTKKTVTRTDIEDGVAQAPVSDAWCFSWADTSAQGPGCPAQPFTTAYNTMTGPDKGTDRIYFLDFNNSAKALSGTSIKTVAPTGEVTEKQYESNGTAWGTGYFPNPFVATEIHSVPAAPGGAPLLAGAETHVVDQNGNDILTKEYDWSTGAISRSNTGMILGPPAGASVVRTTTTGYVCQTIASNASAGTVNQNSPCAYWYPTSPQLRHLPQRSVTSISGSSKDDYAATEYTYDKDLTPNTTPPPHGNITERRKWNTKSVKGTAPNPLNSSNAIVEDFTYSPVGNLSTVADGRGIITNYNWDPSNLYLTSIQINPGSTPSRTTTFDQFDPSTLLLQKWHDDNNVYTTYNYDSIGRLTSSIKALGAGTQFEQHQSVTYHDDTLRITVQKDLFSTSDEAMTSVTAYDQEGRVRLTKQLQSTTQNPDNDTDGIKTQTRYAYGSGASYKLVSNPFCGINTSLATNAQAATQLEQSCAGASTATTGEQTMGWNLTTLDTSGRVVANSTFDGSTPPAPFGGNTVVTGTVTTTYFAKTSDTGASPNAPALNFTSTTDQALHTIVHGVDALGRLRWVKENPTGTTYYATLYAYDPLNDLTNVTQSTQTRTFQYDSLKRLSQATNPESGTIGYTYDADNNLLTKTDARSNLTNYQYDALNRISSKTYTLTSGTAATPSVSYTYDNAGPNSIGHLTSVSNGQTTQNYDLFDALGRPAASTQTTAGKTYLFQYAYNMEGAVTSQTLPSGRTLGFLHDNLNRITGVWGINPPSAGSASTVTGAGQYYASSIAYWPHGAFYSFSRANGVSYGATYNSRLQPVEIDEALNASANALLFVDCPNWGLASAQSGPYGQCPTLPRLTTNNGNLQSVTVYTGLGAAFNSLAPIAETFAYDGLNRISKFTDNGAGSPQERDFKYDAYGNMWITRNDAQLPLSVDPATPAAQGAYNAANNRLIAGTYDASGNQLKLGNYTLTYDAESRQVTEVHSSGGVSGPVTQYFYDGDGKRIQKISNNVTTTYVYDAAGELSAEYSSAPSTASCVTCYLSWDHLGSTRMVTDQEGLVARHPNNQVIERHDYMPFGEEIINGFAGRGALWGATAGVVNQKFTGKERDSESGLDYFGARYYGSALGRFTSADWSAKPEPAPYADFSNPQTLNQYAYVLNNPLGKPDSDGHCAEDLCIVEGTAGAAAGVYVLGGAALAGAAAYLNTPSGQRSLSTFTTAFASSVSSSVDSIKHLITEATGKPGTLGKPDHQETAKEEAKKIGGDREVPIPIPAGGMKGLRKADAAAKDETGKITDVTQVYRPTPAGNIPKREKDAASDIEKATGVKPKMVPVRPLPAQ